MNANGSDITFQILMEAYMFITYDNMEPDGLWAEPHMYIRIRDFITSQPDFVRTFEAGTTIVTGIRFMAADLHRHPSMPPNEIFFYNSRFPQYSIRIINIGEPNV